jgi:LmbE family N-acetylglucosaminyl deacetylase
VTKPIDERLREGARVLWVCPHPDDEFLSGALLVRAAMHHGAPVHILVLTRGDGGDNAINAPDLPAARTSEMQTVADRIGASLELHSFFNAPLPASSFPPRHKLFERWKEQGDPVGVVQNAVRTFRPDIVLTFEPTFGATGHPEHQLTSRITTYAIAGLDRPDDPRPDVFYALRKNWLFALMRQTDPGPVDEWFDGTLPCADTGRTCHEVLVDLLQLHRTQGKDMGAYKKFARFFRKLGLRRVDPASAPLPDEPA